MRVAVTGGTGLVGRFIVDDLTAQGWDVTVLVRPGSDGGGFEGPADAAMVEGTMADDDALDRLVEGADALVHAAFDHAAGRYRGGQGEDALGFAQTNLMRSIHLLETALERGVARCVVLSSRAVFSRVRPGTVLDEDHPVRPDTRYGAIKAALEAYAAGLAAEAGWTVSALRPTGVYGVTTPFEKTKWLALVRGVLREEGGLASRAGTEVHGIDVAAAVRLLLTRPAGEVAGQVYNCSDLYLSTREIAEIVQKLSGARGPLPAPCHDPDFPVMNCDRLKGLGLVFGGKARLEKTLADIIARLGDQTRRP